MAKKKKLIKSTRSKSRSKTKKQTPTTLSVPQSNAVRSFLPVAFFFTVAIFLLLLSIYTTNIVNALAIAVAVLIIVLLTMAMVLGMITRKTLEPSYWVEQIKKRATRKKRVKHSLEPHGPRQWG